MKINKFKIFALSLICATVSCNYSMVNAMDDNEYIINNSNMAPGKLPIQTELNMKNIMEIYYNLSIHDYEQHNKFYYNGRIPSDKIDIVVHMVIDICHKYLHDGGLQEVLNKLNIKYNDDTKQILQEYARQILNNYDNVNHNDIAKYIPNCNCWIANMIYNRSDNLTKAKDSNALWARQVRSKEQFRKALDKHGQLLLEQIVIEIHKQLPSITNISEFNKNIHRVLREFYNKINNAFMKNFNGEGN